MSSPFDAVSTYFLAKDGNRPHLMRQVFTDEAILEMVVKTDAISFPKSAKGLTAIENILARRFADDFENVYSFGLALPTNANRLDFPCHWMVGMSEKNNGPVRVGCGLYNWYFTAGEPCLVNKLIIMIDSMQIVSKSYSGDILDWLTRLPYPWCTPDEVLATMPDVGGLSSIRQYLHEIHASFPG